MDQDCICVIIALILYISHLFGLVFMSVYSYVIAVSALRNWIPTIFSVQADIGLIAILFWHFLHKDKARNFKWIMICSWLLQLASVITILFLNNEKEDLSSGFPLGSDIDAQEKILEVTSSSINIWLFLTHSGLLFSYAITSAFKR